MRGAGGCVKGICSTNAGVVVPSATRPLQPTVVPTFANNETQYVDIYIHHHRRSNTRLEDVWSRKRVPIEVVRGTIIQPLGTIPPQEVTRKELNIGDIMAAYSEDGDKWDFFKLIGKRETNDFHALEPAWVFKRVNYDGSDRVNEPVISLGHSRVFNHHMRNYKIILPESMRITNSGPRDTITDNIRSDPPAGTNLIDDTNILPSNSSVSPPSAETNLIDNTIVPPSDVTTIPGTPLSSSSTSSTNSQGRPSTILRILPPGFSPSSGGKRRKRTNKKTKKTKRKTHRR